MKTTQRPIRLLMICLLLLLTACGQKELAWQEQYDLGVRYLSEGNYEEAIIAFTAAIKIDCKRPEAYQKAAEAYEALGDQEAAVRILTQGYEETGSNILQQELERIGSESISENKEEDSPADSAEKAESDEVAAYFDNSLSWEEVTVGGIQFDDYPVTEETVSRFYEFYGLNMSDAYGDYFSGDGAKLYVAEDGPDFRIRPTIRNATYSSLGFALEFRGITYGMDVDALLDMLGFSEAGKIFAKECEGSVYRWSKSCGWFMAEAEKRLLGDFCDFGVDLRFEEVGVCHAFTCRFLEGKLKEVDICSQIL